MARAKKRTPKVEEVRPGVEGVANNLLDKLSGPDGPPWGTKLTDIEDLCQGTSARLVETRAGDAAWAEPEGYCDRCRRSFFPSVQGPGP